MRSSPLVSSFLRSGGPLLGGAVVSRGSTLVASILVARTVDPASFGRLALIQTMVALLAGLSGLGLVIAVMRQVAATHAHDKQATGECLGTAFTVTLAAALFVTGALMVTSGKVASAVLDTPSAHSAVLASAAAVAGTAMSACAQGGLLGLEAFRSAALSQLVQGVSAGLGLVAGAAAGGLTGALLGLSGGNALAAAVSWRFVRSEAASLDISLSVRPVGSACRSLWRLAAPALVATTVVSLALLWTQLLLSRQPHGFAEVAAFNVSYRWHLAALFIPSAFAPALLPMMTRLLSQREGAQARRLFALHLSVTAVLTVVPACVLIVGAAPILGLSGDFYREHTTALSVLAVAAVPAALNNTLSWASLSAGRVRTWLASDILLAATLVVAAAVLVEDSLATGLALAYLVGYVATDALLAAVLVNRPPASAASTEPAWRAPSTPAD